MLFSCGRNGCRDVRDRARADEARQQHLPVTPPPGRRCPVRPTGRPGPCRSSSDPAARRSTTTSPPMVRLAVDERHLDLGLVEGDDEQDVLLEGGRRGDLRHPRLQELVGRDQPAGLAVHARRVVAVVAEVGGDEDVVRRGRDRLQILRERVEVDDVGLAARRVDDRVEVDEGVVPRCVLVADSRLLGVVRCADPAGGRRSRSRATGRCPCPPCRPSSSGRPRRAGWRRSRRWSGRRSRCRSAGRRAPRPC